MLSAYSAVNQGHRHPAIIKALKDQADILTLTSRAFFNDRWPLFAKKLAELTGKEMILPMNTGAEAVETAIKTMRKWGYLVKKVAADKAEIIVFASNFHGRTTTIVSFSTDPDGHDIYGPFTPGFNIVPYNDLKAVEKAITKNTVGFLVEPIQGEAGVVVPDEGFLKGLGLIAKKNNVLLAMDEIQTGFCRTGKLFAYQHEDVKPDIIIMGKALGGGVFPVSRRGRQPGRARASSSPAPTAPPSAATPWPAPWPWRRSTFWSTKSWPSAPPRWATISWRSCGTSRKSQPRSSWCAARAC